MHANSLPERTSLPFGQLAGMVVVVAWLSGRVAPSVVVGTSTDVVVDVVPVIDGRAV